MQRQTMARRVFTISLFGVALAACSPTVKVEAPDKPIVINLNVKIEQEVRIRVDRDVDRVMQGNPDIF
ncbi:MAG: YnbE family lipoprotein [Rhodobacteraceae bacterium]|nr:YnbE family lipoprotein [Paracoccaceae bacterium]